MNRNTGMIVTGITALLCGCCSIVTCIMGLGGITGNGTYTLGGVDQPMPPAAGYALLCLAGITIVIPVVVGFFTLRKKPEAGPFTNEPLPPAS